MSDAQRRWWRAYREWRIAQRTAATTGLNRDADAADDAAQRLRDARPHEEPDLPHDCGDNCDEVH